MAHQIHRLLCRVVGSLAVACHPAQTVHVARAAVVNLRFRHASEQHHLIGRFSWRGPVARISLSQIISESTCRGIFAERAQPGRRAAPVPEPSREPVLLQCAPRQLQPFGIPPSAVGSCSASAGPSRSRRRSSDGANLCTPRVGNHSVHAAANMAIRFLPRSCCACAHVVVPPSLTGFMRPSSSRFALAPGETLPVPRQAPRRRRPRSRAQVRPAAPTSCL